MNLATGNALKRVNIWPANINCHVTAIPGRTFFFQNNNVQGNLAQHNTQNRSLYPNIVIGQKTVLVSAPENVFHKFSNSCFSFQLKCFNFKGKHAQ